MDREEKSISEWLLLPSSDVSDDDFQEESEDELVFDQIFQEGLERQLEENEATDEIAELMDQAANYPVDTEDTVFPVEDIVLEDEYLGAVSGIEEIGESAEQIIAEDHSEGRDEESALPEVAPAEAGVDAFEEELTVHRSPSDADDEAVDDPDYIPSLQSRGRSRGRGRRSATLATERNDMAPTRGGMPASRGRPPRRGQAPRVFRPVPAVANWQKKEFEPPSAEWKGTIGNPPSGALDNTPYDYFKMFIGDDMITLLTEQTNMYALQSGDEDNFTELEIRQFIGILLYTGIACFPQFRMYWSTETRFGPIADTMSRARFESLLRYFHVVDNTTRVPGQDKLFKVGPLLNDIEEVCRNIPSEQCQSVDEHMIPFKGTSHLKQYVKQKPKKWGYKVFMRCGAQGMLHEFAIYAGRETCPDISLGFSGDIVVHLCQAMNSTYNHKIFCDNWFTSLPLFKHLRDVNGLMATGVIRADRTVKCPLMEENQLKAIGRGAYDSAVDIKSNILAVRWYDNKPISMITTVENVQPVEVCQRWSKQTKQRIDVQRPAVVKKYNESMGGVDLFGMLIALYRINVRSRRGYMRIVHWCFNVAVVNGWLLYRRHAKLNIGKNLTLLQFQTYIARALCTVSSVPSKRRVGRPRTASPVATPPDAPAQKRGRKRLLPLDEARYDDLCHWPKVMDSKGRCAKCKNLQSTISCVKCKVFLCLKKDSNCFIEFHSNE